MSVRGKLSRGCQMCRVRRIKCDETRPICIQCIKSSRACPGYKDEFDVLLRDQTETTRQKVQRGGKKASRRLERQRDDQRLNSSSCAQHGPTGVVAVQQPLEELATCHFISNYILLPHHGKFIGFMEFVVPLLKTGKAPSHYRHAFEACALASLNNGVGNRNHFEQLAIGKYTKALSATSAAIKDPEVAKEDATLATVLLLALFENITGKAVGRLAWGSHVDGAMQLVKLRGREQLQTQLGFDMFITVRMQMIIHSLSSSKPPSMGAAWWIEDACKDSYAAQSETLCIKTGELRSEVARLMPIERDDSSIELVSQMIRRCQALDDKCTRWCQNPPEHFQYESIASTNEITHGQYSEAEVYPGRIDIYNDLRASMIWNSLRCARIVLHSLTLRCMAWMHAPADYRSIAEYSNAASSTMDIARDIMASVPYQLGWFNRQRTLDGPPNLSSFGCGEDDSLKGLSGYFMSWPLAFIYSLDYLADSERTWVRGRLQYIGSQLGVRYSLLLTKMNVRFPSMLIFADRLAAKKSSSTPYDFLKIFSTKKSSQVLAGDVGPQTPQYRTKHEGTSVSVLDEQRAETWLEAQYIATTPI
ncbi:hypothetical protein QQS21_006193 [Conoideocrella luteorostrata]|uniref:Zn(2)-C6 fungal-type domain-containing protein n=1 Tax=Conoideocrella luteorostrata TaxID=1105319 RepID=A0AAJ0CR15_9HYPO|nr:hypothetical protein QQS21_006193 [Conoideocrella luteorostrata]